MAEPEWDEQTRNLALGLDNVALCPLCGRPAEICQSVEHQDDWVPGDPVRCHATTAILARQRGVTEETNPQVEALLWPVQLRAHRAAMTHNQP